MTSFQLPRSQMQRIVIGRLLAAVLVLGAMFFVPAGTFVYWEAWVFLVVLFVPVSVFAAYLLKYNPALLARRLKMREEEPQQKRIVAVTTVVLLATFLLPGFDKRYGWSSPPVWLVIMADFIILSGYLLFVLTLKENEYASRIVEVEQQQRVITTGPYSFVRHPLYLAAILIYGLSPLALGSYWALLPVVLFPVFLVVRILNEERMLSRDLEGYTDYCKVVRYRLIPGIW